VLYGAGVAAVEWFDRLGADAGEEALLVTLRHVAGDRRAIRMEARGARHVRWLATALDGTR
jgi:tRNA A37 threonylcarbamoyladenosine biosynthesis protein TsaE